MLFRTSLRIVRKAWHWCHSWVFNGFAYLRTWPRLGMTIVP